MPVSVECSCGKQFKVMDDLAGSAVRCLECDALVNIPDPYAEPEVDDGSPTRACPACAEQIPKGVAQCPVCKEQLQRSKRPIPAPRNELGTPIAVKCSCGKEFKVAGELAGTAIRCLQCDALVRVPALVTTEEVAVDGSPTKTCPACAEQIPKSARTCPSCKEVLPAGLPSKGPRPKLDPAERELINARIQESLQTVDPVADDLTRGAFLSGTSITALVLTVGFAVMFFGGMGMRNGEAFTILGFIFGFICFICAIVALNNDHKSMNVGSAPTAKEAFSRFLSAAITKRSKRAFGFLVPMARNVSSAETIAFKNQKIVNNQRRMSFHDAASFGEYWKANFTAPSGTTRYSQVKGIRSVGKTADGYEIVEARIEVTSFSTALYLTIFLGLLIAAIIIIVMQQKEEVLIRKAFIKHKDRWYMLDGSLEGDLDRML